LHPELWSAGVFLSNPEAIEEVHRAYLEAGAEILITASYQMSFPGLARVGLNEEQARAMLRGTVELARRTRDRCGVEAMIAASVGPYGAILCDGSEYRGNYGLGVEQLVEFHRPRFEVLGSAGADLLAIETIPSLDEARALLQLLEESQAPPAWFSFSCRDAAHIADGTPIARAAEMLRGVDAVAAVGVNCTAPEFVSGLMDEIRTVSDAPIVVYPNSGEVWDPRRRSWSGAASSSSWIRMAGEWASRGAWAIGGCCRVGPDLIRQVATLCR
jgi:homocysteine S-methyltransferase